MCKPSFYFVLDLEYLQCLQTLKEVFSVILEIPICKNKCDWIMLCLDNTSQIFSFMYVACKNRKSFRNWCDEGAQDCLSNFHPPTFSLFCFVFWLCRSICVHVLPPTPPCSYELFLVVLLIWMLNNQMMPLSWLCFQLGILLLAYSVCLPCLSSSHIFAFSYLLFVTHALCTP